MLAKWTSKWNCIIFYIFLITLFFGCGTKFNTLQSKAILCRNQRMSLENLEEMTIFEIICIERTLMLSKLVCLIFSVSLFWQINWTCSYKWTWTHSNKIVEFEFRFRFLGGTTWNGYGGVIEHQNICILYRSYVRHWQSVN